MGHKESAITRSLLQQGFKIKRVRKHTTMISPDGTRVTIPTSMGRGRSLKNTAAQIRRAGGSIAKEKRGGRPGMV